MKLLKLVDVKPSDLELTYRIKCRSIKPYVTQFWGWDETVQRQIHKDSFKTSNVQFIKYNHEIIGLLAVRVYEDFIYIENVLITDEFQNLGIGKTIMKPIIDIATSEKKDILLQVFKINSKAQKFYKRLGFENRSENENHIEMIKRH